MSFLLKAILGVMTSIFGYYYLTDVVRNGETFSDKRWSGLLGTGFITNFFDTLGIGSLAPQTAIFKFFKLVDDRLIPGTMNIGNTIPAVLQAFIFMTAVEVDPLTLVSMSTAAPLGALLGAGIVAQMSRRRIQIGLGFGLMTVGLIMIAGFLNIMPAGGARFVKQKAYDRKASISLTIAGIIGVLLAAYVVKSLPLLILKGVVCCVVLYTSVWMFISATRKEPESKASII